MHRVLLAGGPALVRDACARVIGASPAFALPAQTATLADALTAPVPRDLLLVDAGELVRGPSAAVRTRLRRAAACTRVAVLGQVAAAELPLLAGAGVTGVLGPYLEPDAFLAALDVVLAGAMVISPAPTPAPQAAASRGALTPLTRREREVLALIATQPDNTAIARALDVRPLTVKSHINRIMHKLEVSSRAQLVVVAYESRLIVPGAPGLAGATGDAHAGRAGRPGGSC
ncbi:LuxR C-terminal-related transcriptional regulator [Streptomyces griseoviridis]